MERPIFDLPTLRVVNKLTSTSHRHTQYIKGETTVSLYESYAKQDCVVELWNGALVYR